MSSSHPTRLVGTYALCFKTSAQSSSLTTHATGVLLAKMAHAPMQWFLAETNSSTAHACSNAVVSTHADINSSHAEINSSPVHADECHAVKGEVSPCRSKYKFLPRRNKSSPVHAHECHADRGEVSLCSWHCPSFSEQLVCITRHKQPANSASSMN